jgi:hypothetical protein
VAPVRTGDFWRCPFDAPLRAYADGRHYYQPNHPLAPGLDRQPERCFADAEDAQLAGYSEALAPEDTDQVEGLFLIRVDLYAECLRASLSLGFVVPCPTHLPNPGIGAAGPSCSGPAAIGELRPPCVYTVLDCALGTTCPPHRAFVLEYSGYALPSALQPGPGGPRAAIVVAAYRTDEIQTQTLGAVTCPQAISEGTTDMTLSRGAGLVQGTILSCPSSVPIPTGGTAILRWANDGVTYQVAVSGGRSGGNLQLLLTLAGEMDFVPIPPDSTQEP